MSKSPNTTKTNNEPKIENANSMPVAETLTQLVTTTQEKPAEASNPDENKEIKYDLEAVKEATAKMNVSQTVRYLHAQGFSRGQIVKEFPKIKGRTILYQHVRNVLITPVKTAG